VPVGDVYEESGWGGDHQRHPRDEVGETLVHALGEALGEVPAPRGQPLFVDGWGVR
jgi:hypothetical protein